ncbi:hypothetical protein NP569_26035, partial [Vibrio parahaemolyticus]|nr:hypothetical protein [Vibrio parahaemolyticus]
TQEGNVVLVAADREGLAAASEANRAVAAREHPLVMVNVVVVQTKVRVAEEVPLAGHAVVHGPAELGTDQVVFHVDVVEQLVAFIV